MSVVYSLNNQNFKLGLWQINETISELITIIKTSNHDFYNHEIAKALSFKNENRQKEWLSIRCLLIVMGYGQYQIQYNENGKPQHFSETEFISISHSGGYASVLISKFKYTGIDIEISSSERVLKILHKFMTDSEISFFKNEEKIKTAYLCWCAKEAIFKASGISGVDFRENITILPFELQKTESFNALLSHQLINREIELKYLFFNELALVYCVFE